MSQLSPGEPMQQIDQLHLTKQIVLEPEDDFFMIRKTRERIVHFAQFGRALFERNIVGFGKMRRAQTKEFLFGQASGRRSKHERFSPRKMFAGNGRFFCSLGSRIAVVDVKHRGVLTNRMAGIVTLVAPQTGASANACQDSAMRWPAARVDRRNLVTSRDSLFGHMIEYN